jgi:hypothetical protein
MRARPIWIPFVSTPYHRGAFGSLLRGKVYFVPLKDRLRQQIYPVKITVLI